MANYGKYYVAVRLLLLKQYLEANAGRNRIVKRRELEDLLREHDMPVEKKTLYADFAALGDICGLQLEYDVHKKGYAHALRECDRNASDALVNLLSDSKSLWPETISGLFTYSSSPHLVPKFCFSHQSPKKQKKKARNPSISSYFWSC